MNYPLLIFVVTVFCLWIAAHTGAAARRRKKLADIEADRGEYSIVLSSTLTLLGLLIGFSFSMAISRYDQRKNFEEEEANAIGTEYLRADLLAEPTRQKLKTELLRYLDLRIQRYEAHASRDITLLMQKTTQVQDAMWSEVARAAEARTDPVMAAVVTGMNDVINRQGYAQAARWNRIPLPAWALMAVISLFVNYLLGYGARQPKMRVLFVIPLVIGVSFLLISDIDSPNGGLIWVAPHNLITLAESLSPH